ncbi:MAG: L-2-hydroxyglutarate oxidase, partial [Flavobacteriales bacterium]|nr:L-2-hydroxyglutarate oxidase [Flavobacteriales bacterium]
MVKTSNSFDFAIVGGGIVGLSCAFKLQVEYPQLNIVVFEKEQSLAAHQTGRNSGVIHSGLYYRPGSFRAKNCVNGRMQLVEFAKKYNIKHDVCGKVVVAVTPDEVERLEKICETGKANGLEGIEKIDAVRLKEIEPYVEGIAALWVPESGIIDFVGVTNKLAELITDINPNSQIIYSCEVKSFDDGGLINTTKGQYKSDKKILCGGLFSDRLAQKDKVHSDVRIVGFRGDYYDLSEKGKSKVNNLIYPVPNPEFPFLGVHFTRMVDGSIECGPNAVFTFKREGYGKTDFNLKDTLEALMYKGTWKLFFKHWRFGLNEYKRAFSKRLFLKELNRLIPSLKMDDIV